jgi:hypothetical protein
MTEAVLDAWPLIDLAELDALDVLRDFSLLRDIPYGSSLYVRSSLLKEIICELEVEWNAT